MKIKICGLFRDEDIDSVNEARPDYIGFVFAKSRRQVTAAQASGLRRRLEKFIIPVGVFVNAPVTEIASLYRDGVISAAQLHGTEDQGYIERLKKESAAAVISKTPIPVIKTIQSDELESVSNTIALNADYYLIDSGAGSGKVFDWKKVKKAPGTFGGVAGAYSRKNPAPAEGGSLVSMIQDEGGDFPPHWFLAGGIDPDNIREAMALKPFGIDVSSGAETDGLKDRKKILQLTAIVRESV